MDDAAVDQDLDVVDFTRGLTDAQKEKLVPVETVPCELIEAARKAYKNYGKSESEGIVDSDPLPTPCTVYEHKDFPGEEEAHSRGTIM